MVRFLVRRVVPPVVLTTLGVLFVSEGVPALLLGWALLGYLVWRALPGIRRDLGTVRRLWASGAGAHGGTGLRLGRRVSARSGDL